MSDIEFDIVDGEDGSMLVKLNGQYLIAINAAEARTPQQCVKEIVRRLVEDLEGLR